jgi:O-antigen/teichoic acid export membrane protein
MDSSAPPVTPDGDTLVRASPRLHALSRDLSSELMAKGARDNLLGMAAERLLGVAMFLTLPFLLSGRNLGQYYEVVALVTVATVVATAGLDVGLVRFTGLSAEAGRLDQVGRYLRTALRVGAVTSGLAAVGLYLEAPSLARVFGNPGMASAIRLGAGAIPLLVGASLLVSPSRGLKLMSHSVVAIQLVQPGVQLAVTVALVAGGLGLLGATAGLGLAGAAACVTAAVLFLRLSLPSPTLSQQGPVIGSLLRFSAPVSGMALTTTGLMWVDTLLIGVFRSPQEVATYGIVVRLMTLSTAILLAVMQIFGPFVTQFLYLIHI